MNSKIIMLAMLFCSTSAFAQTHGDPAAGRAKYQMFCVSCHGASGKGDGPAAAALKPAPRNLADKTMMAKKTDAYLKKVIQLGGPASGLSPSMPPWGSALTEQDIANVIAYIRSL